MELEKKVLLSTLFHMYGALLTSKQQEIFKAYMLDDYSLKETAEAFNVSRSAIFDHMQKIEGHLFHFEDTLGLYKTSNQRKKLLDQLEQSMDKKIIEAIRKLDE